MTRASRTQALAGPTLGVNAHEAAPGVSVSWRWGPGPALARLGGAAPLGYTAGP